MTETGSEYLNRLTTYWTPTPAQFDNARRHRGEIEDRLSAYLEISEMFETGSMRHGTGVYQFSDADYLVVLRGDRPSDPLTALGRVKRQLEARYPGTSINVRQPAVVCNFTDTKIEVVPAYSAIGGGYYIPDPTGGWMTTFPKQHNSYVSDANTRLVGVKSLARQAKIWKYRREVPVSSCYLEMRAAQYMNTQTSYIPVADLYFFLSRLAGNELAAMNDPTGLGSRFTSTSSAAYRADALSKLNRAVSRASRAYLATDQDDVVQCLTQLFDW